ncbi:MAG: FeoB-associated Cys-rich membrane protein [Bacteroidales bacterium]|nr:FeoB-associated Cys-rich membrane protein [Bacteroidales bacterium]
MTQEIGTIIIIACATAFVVYKIIAMFRKKNTPNGCCSNCEHCPMQNKEQCEREST